MEQRLLFAMSRVATGFEIAFIFIGKARLMTERQGNTTVWDPKRCKGWRSEWKVHFYARTEKRNDFKILFAIMQHGHAVFFPNIQSTPWNLGADLLR